MIINDFQQAYDELKTYVENIARSYNTLADDVAQSCWVRIGKHLKDHGPSHAAMLVTIAKHSAKDCASDEQSHGLLPKESKFPRPSKITPKWMGGGKDADNIPEPSTETVEDASDLYDHLLAICEDDDQRAVVMAGKALAAAHADDGDVTIGTMTSLQKQTGLTVARIKKAQKALADRCKR